MSRDDEYGAKAAEVQREAGRSTNEVDRAAWLRMVDGFVSLISKPRRQDRPWPLSCLSPVPL